MPVQRLQRAALESEAVCFARSIGRHRRARWEIGVAYRLLREGPRAGDLEILFQH